LAVPALRSDLRVERWVVISMLAICYASDVIEYVRRRPGLLNAPLIMEYGSSSTE